MNSEKTSTNTLATDGDVLTDPDLDWIYDALCHRSRRLVLAHLVDGDDTDATLDELATTIRQSTSTGRGPEEIETALVHRHLPALDHAGLIEYDGRDDPVVYDPDRLVEANLSLVEDGSSA